VVFWPKIPYIIDSQKCTASGTSCKLSGTVMNTRLFWSRVKFCIKARGTTQKQTAQACRLPYSTFRNWINKNVNPPVLYADKISRYLGVSLVYLISGQGNDYISQTNEKVILLLKQAEENMNKIRRN